MNRFLVRNLMIQALTDEAQLDTGVVGLAPNFGACPNIFSCAGGISCCALTLVRFPSLDRIQAGQSATSPVELDLLKRELRLALARIEKQERELAEQLKPQDLEEVELLEAQHNQALEELRARRNELKNRDAE